MWSRDERRENRKVMRAARDRDAIADSIEGNSSDREGELLERELDTWCDHELDENGWCPCDDVPRHRPAKRRRASARWCRRKVGREHVFTLLETRKYRWSPTVHVCSVCGKKKYEWRR